MNDEREPKFDHERLEVYRSALEFVVVANEIGESLRGVHAHLGDQLRRASTSIVLNIAEGAGEFSRREKVRFYRMALRSTTECAAIIDIVGTLRAHEPRALWNGKAMLIRTASMLTKLILAVEGRGTGAGTGSGTTAEDASR